jgi:hypothetical protein
MQKAPDYRLKPLHKLFRPYFSPYTNSYEIDYVYGGVTKVIDIDTQKTIFVPRHYFFCININTKYLIVKPLPMGEKGKLDFTLNAMKAIKNEIEKMNPEQSVSHIRGDSDSAFAKVIIDEETLGKKETTDLGAGKYRPNKFVEFLKANNISLYLSPSKFTNKNRVVDRVIRTIRDKLGENPVQFYEPENIQKAVNEYNNSRHAAFNHEYTPREVQMHKDLEEYYIRENMNRAEEVKLMQSVEGLFLYKPGDVLLIHHDFSKTADKLNKTRRTFNRLAEFLGYDHGNVVCRVLRRTSHMNEDEKKEVNKTIVIPIFYTKFLANSLKETPKEYKSLIF